MAWQKLVLEIMKPIKYIKQERGALVVLTAVLLPVLFGFMGIAYDVGNLYMHKARLQNVTDAAALAGGEVFKNPPENDPQYTDKLTGQLIVLQHKHEAADGVAGDYIKKNEVNLGNNITILERSALGYKGEPVQSGNVTTGKTYIYYRVIATEEVPVYFLPVIMSDKTKQTVKATSVALVETTTTITQPSSSGESTPVRNPSIFDNLFTYSEYFDPGLTNAENNIKATFEGNMVFTYGDGSGTQGNYYDLDAVLSHIPAVAKHLFVDAYANPSAIVNGDSDALWSSINDPIIDTFYNTTAYVEAFKNKLKGPHRDVKSTNVTIDGKLTGGGDGKVNNGCIVAGPDNLKFWLLGEYYPLNANGERLTFTSENKTYYVCYHKLKGFDRFLRVAQNDEDSKLYLIGNNNAFTGFYIGTKEDVETIFNASGVEDLEGYKKLKITEYTLSKFSHKTQSDTTEYSNIYHIGSRFQSNNNNTTITIKDLPEGETPLYIIIDSSINGSINVKINTINNSNNSTDIAFLKRIRPVILVYFGTSNIKLEAGKESNGVTNLSVYAPYGTVGVSQNEADQDTQINLHGTLYGNIVAKRIAIDTSGNTGAWHQKNFLNNDEDIIAATKDMLKAVNAKTVPEEIKTEVKQYYTDALSGNVDMDDPYFYSKLSYEDKITLYRAWEYLCNQDKYAEYTNMLWPWNDHFDLIIPEQEDITPTVDSNSVIRIINPKIEDNPYFSNDSNV